MRFRSCPPALSAIPAALLAIAAGCSHPATSPTADVSPAFDENFPYYEAKWRVFATDLGPAFVANRSGKKELFRLESGKVVPYFPPSGGDAGERAVDAVAFTEGSLLTTDERAPPDRGFRRVLRFDRRGSAAVLSGVETASREELCADRRSGRIAWRDREGRQAIAKVDAGGEVVRDVGPIPAGFLRCEWASEKRLVGLRKGEGESWEAVDCVRAGGARMACRTRSLAIEPGSAAPSLWKHPTSDEAGILMRAAGSPRRLAYRLGRGAGSLTPSPGIPKGPEEVIGYDGEVARLAFHARYFLDVAASEPETISSFARLPDGLYAIATGVEYPQSLVKLVGGRWKRVEQGGQLAPGSNPIREVWLRSEAGTLYQAFYFGSPVAKDAFLFLPGGGSNVSPRYSYWFYPLVSAGYGVLAVNYPGSPGRGSEYERWDESRVAEAAATAARYLAENGFRRVVSWSISAGLAGQRAFLDGNAPISAVVDYMGRVRVGGELGYDTRANRGKARARGIPFYTVRADLDLPDPEPADFRFPAAIGTIRATPI